MYYRIIPAKHWAASQIPRLQTTSAALALGPVSRRSVMEVNRKVVAVNTTPPTRPYFQKSCWQAKPAMRGRMPKVIRENTGMQI